MQKHSKHISMGLESRKDRVCLWNNEKFGITAVWWEEEKSKTLKGGDVMRNRRVRNHVPINVKLADLTGK